MQSVELTACRTGFMLCNDLEIAARMLQAEPPMGAVDLTPKEKIQELILFSVSESYFKLREALGIQIQVRD
jgi:ABC-type taurine transport system ATPase subunit